MSLLLKALQTKLASSGLDWIKLESLQLEHLGRAKKITVDKNNTTIVEGGGKRNDIDKRVEEGSHLVELEVFVENQLGEITAKGSAIVELPARGAAPRD